MLLWKLTELTILIILELLGLKLGLILLTDKLSKWADNHLPRWRTEHRPRHPGLLFAHCCPVKNALVIPIAQYLRHYQYPTFQDRNH